MLSGRSLVHPISRTFELGGYSNSNSDLETTLVQAGQMQCTLRAVLRAPNLQFPRRPIEVLLALERR